MEKVFYLKDEDTEFSIFRHLYACKFFCVIIYPPPFIIIGFRVITYSKNPYFMSAFLQGFFLSKHCSYNTIMEGKEKFSCYQDFHIIQFSIFIKKIQDLFAMYGLVE